MRGIGYTKLVIGVLIAALVLGMAAVRPLVAARSRSSGHTLDHDPATLAEALVNGEYRGQVALEGVYTGVFSDTLEPNEIDLGYIDLALALEQSGGEVSGHVVLTHTLVFTQENTIDGGGGVGPLVAGTFDGTTLQLTSEKFYRVTSGGRTLADGRILPERTATRQFSLISTEVVSPGVRLKGEYRETIWGLTPLPVTVVGTFGLEPPPAFAEPPEDEPGDQRGYLPLVMRGFVACADAYEPDDVIGQAREIATDGTAQPHNFYLPGDVDWLAFEVPDSSVDYVIETLDPAGADTIIYLVDSDGERLLDWNDDAEPGNTASRLDFDPYHAGTFYVRIVNYDPQVGGCGVRYAVRVTAQR